LVRAPFALAASLVVLLLGVASAGPSPSIWLLAIILIAAVSPFVVLGVLTSREVASLQGTAAPSVLGASKPWLASALRSAAELGEHPAGSPALRDAHREAVTASLGRLDLNAELETRRPAMRAAASTIAAFAVALLAGAFEPHVAAGLYAISHPFAKQNGERLALVVAGLHIRATPPRHRGGQPVELQDPSRIVVDEGAQLAIDVTLRIDASSVDVDLAGRPARLVRLDGRHFRGETTARTTGPVAIRLRTADEALVDAKSRRIDVRDDASPVIRVVSVSPESPVERDAEITIRIDATDDVGLHELAQTVRAPNGTETRTVLASPEAHTLRAEATSVVRLADLDLRPGDTITVGIEAIDDDSVDGPKTTRSEPIAIRIDDGHEARDRATADLRAVLDEAITSLAARLEADAPTPSVDLIARAARLAISSRGVADRIRLVLDAPEETVGLASPDRGLLRSFERRLNAAAAADETAAVRGVDAVTRADATGIDATEDIVLAVADLLGRLELEDAATIAREIAALQRELASLVRELRENPSDSLRASIRATMQRIRQRMAELAAKLGSMRDELPAEFRNAAAAASAEASDALSELEQALADDDLDAAERSVVELEQALRQMTQSSSAAEDELQTTRFGPRQQAFAAAFESLAELEVEESTLANESARIRDGLSQRAAEAIGDERTNGLAPLAAEARRIETQLRQLGRISGAPVDDDALERTLARLDDAREALSRGDLGEAREMMNRTTGTAESIASDLELSRRMFDSPDRRTAQASETARAAADALRALDDSVTRALPALEAQIRAADQSAMSANNTRQARARDAAGRIAEQLGGSALGEPIAPDIADGLHEAQGMMTEAETALSRQDAVGAANAEARAARRLRELREEIEQQSSSSSGGGGGGGGGGSSGSASGEVVEVPTASASEDATTRRRRVLDAMGDDVPEAYRGSVRRYYEELLR